MSNARELAELGLEVDVDTSRIGIGSNVPTWGFQVNNPSTANSATGSMLIDAGLNGSGEGLVITSNTRTINESSTAILKTISRDNSVGLKVQADGRVGIGIDSPQSALHVAGQLDTNGPGTVDKGVHMGMHVDAFAAIELSSSAGNSGWIDFRDTNDSDYSERIRGGTGDLQFHTTGSERMRIYGDGRVDFSMNGNFSGSLNNGAGVGIYPGGYLQVNRLNDTPLALGRHGTTGNVQTFFYGTASNNMAGVGTIGVTSSGTTYNTTSDRRLKDNIEPIADGTEKLMAMKPVTHTWIANPEADAVHGFIAQEMQEIIPEAVSGDPDGEEMMSMDYGRITPVLVAALQDAHNKITALEERLAELEAK